MGQPWSALEPPSAEDLVSRIHALNRAWHELDEGDRGHKGAVDHLRRLKGLVQVRLLRQHPERALLAWDEERGAWLVFLSPQVAGRESAAHITDRALRALGYIPPEEPAATHEGGADRTEE